MTDIVDDFLALINHSGISTYALAQRTGLTPATIKNWKEGKFKPSRDSMNRILHVLGKELTVRDERVQQAYKPNNVPRMAVWMRQP